MVTFSHLDAGTTETEWLASERLRCLPALELTTPKCVIVLAAHPDDETLGAAGLVSRLSQLGAQVTIIVASDGEASHPLSPTHAPPALATMRREELRKAVSVVAPRSVVEFLGFPDGGLREHIDKLSERIRGFVSARDSPGVLLLAPWEGDGHPDHQIVAAVAREISQRIGARLLEYPIWMWHWASPEVESLPWPLMSQLTLSPEEQELKRRSLSMHHSQLRPLSDSPGDEAMVGAEMHRHFDRNFEVYIESERRP